MKEDKKYDHGFKVPSDYFDGLDDALNVRIMEEALPDKSGFKAPDDYFNSLEDTLWNRIAEEEGKNEETTIYPHIWNNKCSMSSFCMLIIWGAGRSAWSKRTTSTCSSPRI